MVDADDAPTDARRSWVNEDAVIDDALRAAVERYREAAISLGVTWPTPRQDDPPEGIARLFDVERIPDEVVWLHSLGLVEAEVLPEGAFVLPWPQSPREALGDLSGSPHATPFPWRRQLPLFGLSGVLVFTLVLDGKHGGEVWRYEIGADCWDKAVRAAQSLPSLFTQWTTALTSGIIRRGEYDGCLQLIGDGLWPLDTLRRVPDLDVFSYPVAPLDEPELRQRQRECGVDLNRIEDFEAWDAVQREAEAVIAALEG